MIVTLTANPSLDRTAALPTPLTRGGVHRLRHANAREIAVALIGEHDALRVRALESCRDGWRAPVRGNGHVEIEVVVSQH